MKNYIYKIGILFFFIYILYEFTLGKEVRFFKNRIVNNLQSFEAEKYKSKIKEEAKKLLAKDKIFYEEDAEIISRLLKKISKELNLN